MTISPRYLLAIVVLFALAAIPTVIHGYVGLRVDDGRRAAMVSAPVPGLLVNSGVRARGEGWAERRFDTRDWFEQSYATPDGEVRLSVARTYDAKKVYHHPELAVSYGIDLPDKSVVRFGARPDVPVHVLRNPGGVRKMALYALHYDDTFVERPILFQLRISAQSLVSGRRPMTLFYVTADDPRRESLEETWAARVLLAAVGQFAEQAGQTAASGVATPGRP